MHNRSASSTSNPANVRRPTPSATTIRQVQLTQRSTTPSNRQVAPNCAENPEVSRSRPVEFATDQAIMRLASEQLQTTKLQVQICEQMKLSVAKYFSSLSHVQDTVLSALDDFKTPKPVLLESL